MPFDWLNDFLRDTEKAPDYAEKPWLPTSWG